MTTDKYWTTNEPPPCPHCGEPITDEERDLSNGGQIECMECSKSAVITMVLTRRYHADACDEDVAAEPLMVLTRRYHADACDEDVAAEPLVVTR